MTNENNFNKFGNEFLLQANKLKEKYNFLNLTEHEFEIFYLMFAEKNERLKDLTPSFSLIELAKLVLTLKKTLDNKQKIAINTTLSNFSNKIELKETENIKSLYYFVDSLLNCNQGGFYEFAFGWEKKESLFDDNTKIEDLFMSDLNHIEDENMENLKLFSGFTKPYTESELEEIIELGNESVIGYEKNYKKLFNRYLKDFINNLRKKNIFDNSYRTISTNEACFIYDLLVAAKFIPLDLSITMNNQDKYQCIKKMSNSVD